MVTLSPASIVIMPFPFSDLSATKLRPAVVLADSDDGDWLLCQVTSNPYSDPHAIQISQAELNQGSLNLTSFARPLKLFTADASIITKRIAVLKDDAFKAILQGTIAALNKNMPT